METPSTVEYRVVGLGRAGRSLIAALANTNWLFVGGYGRDDDPVDAADGVDVVFVTVPDSAIAETARRIRPGSAVLIHLSGAKTLDVLEPHQGRASVHPLVSLPDPVTGSGRLRNGTTFAVAGHHLAVDLVAVLGGRSIEVEDGKRPLYHAAAAIAANHLVVVCAQIERIAAHIDVPVDLYWQLMRSTIRNVEAMGAVEALTGPAARGDTATIDAHLGALSELGDSEVDLYRALADRAAELGRLGREAGGHRQTPQ